MNPTRAQWESLSICLVAAFLRADRPEERILSVMYPMPPANASPECSKGSVPDRPGYEPCAQRPIPLLSGPGCRVAPGRRGTRRTMKEKLKTLLMAAGLLRVWNRWLGGNRLRTSGGRNQVRIGKSLLTQTRIRVQGRNNIVSIGDGCRLRDLKILVAGDSIRVDIADSCQLRGKIIVEDTGSRVEIGAGTTMENALLSVQEGAGIRIGNDCMFSALVGVRAGDTHSILDASTGQRLNPPRSVAIERHVWLCAGVTVLKGCQIGAGTVVGGFSVVTASLPPEVLAVGSPAKVVRTGISWQRERVAVARGST